MMVSRSLRYVTKARLTDTVKRARERDREWSNRDMTNTSQHQKTTSQQHYQRLSQSPLEQVSTLDTYLGGARTGGLAAVAVVGCPPAAQVPAQLVGGTRAKRRWEAAKDPGSASKQPHVRGALSVFTGTAPHSSPHRTTSHLHHHPTSPTHLHGWHGTYLHSMCKPIYQSRSSAPHASASKTHQPNMRLLARPHLTSPCPALLRRATL